jgi:hypothetical protein
VIHVPSTVKHIHHHHTNKLLVTPRHQHESVVVGDGWSVPKVLENTNGWSEEHVTGHGFSGSDHEDWYKSKGSHVRGHGHWRQGKATDDFLSGIRSIGDERPHVGSTGRSPFGWKQGRDGSFGSIESGVWQAVKGHAGVTDGPVHGKLWNGGAGAKGNNRERRHQSNGPEGTFIAGKTRLRGRYAVQEHPEEQKATGSGTFPSTDGRRSPGDWDGLNKAIGRHSTKHSSTSSYEAKDHNGNSYSSFVLHSADDGRHSA